MQAPNGVHRRRLGRVTERQQSKQVRALTSFGEPGHRASLSFQRGGDLGHRRQVDVEFLHEPRAAQPEVSAAHDGRHPTSGNCSDLAGRRHTDPLPLGSLDDSTRQRMLAVVLDGCSRSEHAAGVAIDRLKRHEFRLALGQRPGLVEGDDLDAVRDLECFGVLDQNPVTCGNAGAGHDGGGRGQAKGARAGNDQHCNGIEDRSLPVARAQPPAQQCQGSDADDHRDEHGAHLVDKSLDRRLFRLRRLDKPNDACEGGFGTDRRGPDEQQTLSVDGAAGHAVTDMLGHGQAFTGDQRFVDLAGTLNHLAVDRNPLARAHDNLVVNTNLGDRHIQIGTVAANPGSFGAEGVERANRLRGLPLGTRLQPLAEQDQRDNDRRGFEVQVVHAPVAMDPQLIGAQAVARTCAQGDEQVHIPGAGAQRFPSSPVEARAKPELDRRGQRELQPAREHPVGTEQRGEHRKHERGGERHGHRDGPPFGQSRFCRRSIPAA
mmetsp:Transcript_21742/g.84881  ORF Transcript_21742/g.84881 Transcript_21742/m.84881 type:complete len:490 (-) Transcript_21742:3015-4484(-)